MGAKQDLVYVGTYTHPGKSEGIYVYRVEADSGALSHLYTVADVPDPAFLAFSPDNRFLFAVNWLKEYEGTPGGAVSAFAVDPTTGKLSFLNRQPSGGVNPCHLCVDPSGHYVLVANHESGTVAVLPIGPDGCLGVPSDVVQHRGSGPRPTQLGPHAHYVAFDPDGRFVLACDKGADRVMVYHLDTVKGRLVAHDTADALLHAGAGPRHLVFSPGGSFVYVNNEQDSTVSVFVYDASGGALRHIRTETTLPPTYDGKNTSSEIAIHPSGRFLYVSNRGHNSIAIFGVDVGTGRITSLGHQQSGGRKPRFFAINPGGSLLYAANQESDCVVLFRIDQSTGLLSPTGEVTHVPTPVCLLFRSPSPS